MTINCHKSDILWRFNSVSLCASQIMFWQPWLELFKSPLSVWVDASPQCCQTSDEMKAKMTVDARLREKMLQDSCHVWREERAGRKRRSLLQEPLTKESIIHSCSIENLSSKNTEEGTRFLNSFNILLSLFASNVLKWVDETFNYCTGGNVRSIKLLFFLKSRSICSAFPTVLGHQ